MSKQTLDALRSKLTLPRLIFFTSAGAATVLAYRDTLLTKEARYRLIERAKPLADEPLPVNEMPRKVIVYMSAPPGDNLHKSRVFFKRYIKPIWDAAALDYDIKEGSKPGEIQRHVRNLVRRERRQILLNPNENSSVKELDGSVALGRVAFVELVNGLSDGSFGPIFERQKVSDLEEIEKEKIEGGSETSVVPMDQRKKNKEIKANRAVIEKLDEKTKLDTEEEKEAEEAATIPDDVLFTLESNQTPPRLPPIGFITLRNIIGWSHLPQRIYAWFTDHQQIEAFGEQALMIAMGRKRKLKSATELETFGIEEKEEIRRWGQEERKLNVDDRVTDVLEVYV